MKEIPVQETIVMSPVNKLNLLVLASEFNAAAINLSVAECI